ncbi:hypothetical protein ART_3381 [Arthrobacter sp. PAMC 25486]|uniref:hypothetical protein n=1 Tax=Arthrobacter sp. PAMC 25486 TaxID=1494608 RepID=UPI0005363DBF|nr:hypothetical protein [Arthrobacter sp. PAMC 25486]AIY02980.1 hypothetical protein ART_3381 [Arthrobacter sp. PAMC 25486]
MELVDHSTEPTHDQLLAEVLAGLQHGGLRDQILAALPGINEPMAATLFGATDDTPQLDRFDSSEKLLRQLLTTAASMHAAASEYVQDLGYPQGPIVVIIDHHHLSGFKPTKIERLRLTIQ